MAQIVRSGWRERDAIGVARAKSQPRPGWASTYRRLHGVPWSTLNAGRKSSPTYGEVDFIVLAPSRRALLIEQKSVFLSETGDCLVKPDARKPKHVVSQMMRNVSALINRFRRTGEGLSIGHLLYCPVIWCNAPPSPA
jgi:hypothetical protein